MEKLTKNSEYIAEIVSYNSEGLGVARINGNAVFIPNAIIGEFHKIRIVKSNSTVTYGISMDILSSSQRRVEPDCPYFAKCGGCHLMHMNYDEELSFKLSKVNDALKRIAKSNYIIEKIIPSDDIYRYRNKAVFNVVNGKAGFFKSRTHELIQVDDCLLQQKNAIDVANILANVNLNHISLRGTVCTVYGSNFNGVVPQNLSGLVLCKNHRENSLLDGDFSIVSGSPDQIMTLGKYKFIVSPKSFFQINTKQAEKLYLKAAEYAGEGDLVIELYCGVGTISSFLSENFNRVRACEIVPEAIENANRNKLLNNINNIEFVCCDSKDMISSLAETIVVDPPRKGLDTHVIDLLLNSNSKKIVYVSCNPSTLARDINLLSEKYCLAKGICVDMFPRTYHVETVVLLVRR